jgi:L-asparaginase / beta-aspartyl-peptidase
MRALKRLLPVLLAASITLVVRPACTGQAPHDRPARKLVLVIHGGEADPPEPFDRAMEPKYKAVLEEALTRGWEVLNKPNGTSLDGVEAAIKVLEDSPLFNAGNGAVFTHDGHNELDASIMEGKEKRAGAVAGVTIVKNPISAARAVLEHSPHIFLVGRAAELFAIKRDLPVVHPDYFWTEDRWNELQKALKEEEEEEKRRREGGNEGAAPPPRRHLGTVGAVALDRDGNLAAGTSTGGMTNKWSGRVGDSPIIGAGTYADNDACAVSCTGWGEYFIRYAVAHDIAARVKYAHRSVRDAAEDVINGELAKVRVKGKVEEGVEGGVIVLDRQGKFHITFNKAAKQMNRGYIASDDPKPHVAVLEELPKP